jgi:hypothetical protein
MTNELQSAGWGKHFGAQPPAMYTSPAPPLARGSGPDVLFLLGGGSQSLTAGAE